MSLIQSQTKLKDLVLVGKVNPEKDKKLPKSTKSSKKTKSNTTYIYYDPLVKKDLRVKELKFNVPIDSKPYLDLRHNQRSASFISGISGSGKSTLCAKIIQDLRKLRKEKDRSVYCFTSSALDNVDPAFEDLPDYLEIIPLDHPDFLNISIQQLANSIVVFDDYENIASKPLESYVLTFIKDVLERGRKLGIDVIVINHMTQNFNKTKNIIFECDTYYLNISMNRNSSEKFLASYMNLTKKQLEEIIKYEYDFPFIWSVFHKSSPQYYIQENTIKLL